MPFDRQRGLEGVGVRLPVAGDLGLVVEAEAGTDVLRDKVDLPVVHHRDPLLAGAEAELALDRVAGVLEDLGVDLGDQLGLVEVVRADLDRFLGRLGGRLGGRRRGRGRSRRRGARSAAARARRDQHRGHPERQHAGCPHLVSPPHWRH